MILDEIVFSVIKTEFEKVRDFVLEYSEKEQMSIEVNNLETDDLLGVEQREGGAHLPVYAIWKSDLDDITFFVSNYRDGLVNFTNFIGRKMKVKVINASILSKSDFPKISYECLSENGQERVVQLLKDSRWEFCEEGEPLPYEQIESYNKRIKKDRLTGKMILDYLQEENVDVKKAFTQLDKGIVVKRLSW